MSKFIEVIRDKKIVSLNNVAYLLKEDSKNGNIEKILLFCVEKNNNPYLPAWTPERQMASYCLFDRNLHEFNNISPTSMWSDLKCNSRLIKFSVKDTEYAINLDNLEKIEEFAGGVILQFMMNMHLFLKYTSFDSFKKALAKRGEITVDSYLKNRDANEKTESLSKMTDEQLLEDSFKLIEEFVDLLGIPEDVVKKLYESPRIKFDPTDFFPSGSRCLKPSVENKCEIKKEECTCEISVLTATGCKCGAIKRWENKRNNEQ